MIRQVAGGLFIGALLLASSLLHAMTAQAGPHAVEVSDHVWRDAARQRDIPLRVFRPGGAHTTRFPVILFSHGLGGSRSGGRAWGEHWASHGYVCIHMQHAGSDEALWRDQPIVRALQGLRAAMSAPALIDRLADVSHVIDRLQKAQNGRTSERSDERGDETWRTLVDATRIGLAGHSFGAVTAQFAAGQRSGPQQQAMPEPRLLGFVAFSPSSREADPVTAFGRIERPFLSITGTDDGEPEILRAAGSTFTPANRLIPFEAMPSGTKYLLVFRDADHMVFNAAQDGVGQRNRKPSARAVDAHVLEVSRAVSLAFWDATLKSDERALRWLTQEVPADPAVAGLSSGDQFKRK